MPAQLKFIFKIFSQYILAVILIVLGLIANLNRILFYLLPQLQSSTPPIAFVLNSNGDVEFRNAFDTIWVPPPTKALLYSGDYIRTGKGGIAKISLDLNRKVDKKGKTENNTVELTEETFARITLERGSFKIKLMSGEVITELDSKDIKVVIQKGDKIQNESAEKRLTQKKIIRGTKADTPDFIPPTAAASDTSKKSETIEEKQSEIVYQTTPHNRAVLLFMSDQEIPYRFPEKCENTCILKLWIGQNQVTNKSFKNGEEIQIMLQANENHFGNYTWQVTTGLNTYTGGFALLKYSKENLSKSIKEGSEVEINP